MDLVRAEWDALDRDLRRVLVGNTDKISAIKYLRALTGLGLADAKRAIEEFQP